MTPQPGTAGTDDDPLDSIATEQLVVNGEVIDTLVGLAFDSANATDGVLRFDGTGSTNGITDGSAKVIVGGTVYDVAGGEWVDFSGTSHSLDSWEKVINSQFDVSITGVSPDPVKPGNTLDVTADVSNAGTDQDTQTVTLDIDNSVGQVDSTSVTLSGGGSTTQTLSWAVPPGQTEQDYTATVSSADDTASQTVTVSSVPPSLVSHWTFNSADTNSGTAIDTVGSNDGTISGATTGVSGANQTYTTNEAYSFDGNGDGVDFGRVGDGLEAFSVAAWVNPDSLAGDASILIRDGGTKQTDRHWGLRIDDSSGTVGFFVEDTDGTKVIATSSTTISTGSWSHVVGTMGGTTATIYVDGTAEGSASDGGYGVQPSSAQPAKAAGANPGGYVYYGGEIDDARFYDKELTSTEVSNLYSNGAITDGSPFFDTTITSTSGPVKPGNTLDVTADITNNGTNSDTQTVTLDINNSVGQVDSTSVTLSGGGSTTQTLSWAVPSGQTKQDYQATVSSADDAASQTVAVGSPYITDFDQTFPYSAPVNNGSLTFDVVDSTAYSNGPALTIDQDAADGNTFNYVTKDVDATGQTALECVTEFSRDGQYDKLRIDLGGQTLYDSASGHSFTQRSFDISGISGVVTLKIGHYVSKNETRETQSTIAEIQLV